MRWLLVLLMLLATPAWSAITQVGSTTITTVGNDTSTDCASPSGTQADDILVVFFTKDDDDDVTPDTGWDTAVELGVTTETHDRFSGIYWELLTGAADATYTFTHDREATVCAMIALRGVDTTNVTDVVGSYTANALTANPSASTITTTVRATGPNVWALHSGDAGTTMTSNCGSGTGWDEADDTTNGQIGHGLYYTNVDPDGATGPHSANGCSVADWLSVLISFEDDDPPTGGRTRRSF